MNVGQVHVGEATERIHRTASTGYSPARAAESANDKVSSGRSPRSGPGATTAPGGSPAKEHRAAARPARATGWWGSNTPSPTASRAASIDGHAGVGPLAGASPLAGAGSLAGPGSLAGVGPLNGAGPLVGAGPLMRATSASSRAPVQR
jgi:hypothetical protein